MVASDQEEIMKDMVGPDVEDEDEHGFDKDEDKKKELVQRSQTNWPAGRCAILRSTRRSPSRWALLGRGARTASYYGAKKSPWLAQ